MTDTQDQTAAGSPDSPSVATRRRSGLSGMLLPELQGLAGSLGIPAAKMRKAELVDAITAARAGSRRPDTASNAGANGTASGAATGSGPMSGTASNDASTTNGSVRSAPRVASPSADARTRGTAAPESTGGRNGSSADARTGDARTADAPSAYPNTASSDTFSSDTFSSDTFSSDTFSSD
ncbi:MAG: Rho termination factor N-terminal domain-containing protein, partial [bacterium]